MPRYSDVGLSGWKQATLLDSTLAKGTTGRTANIVRTSADFGLPPQAEEEATSPNAARTAGVESGDALSLSKIFDDHADDEIRDLKTLTRYRVCCANGNECFN